MATQQDPTNIPLVTYAITVGIAMWGGVVHLIKQAKSSPKSRISLLAFLGSVTTSGFCGLLSLYLGNIAHLDAAATAIISGIAGYSGVRFVELLEWVLTRRVLSMAPQQPKQGPQDGN